MGFTCNYRRGWGLAGDHRPGSAIDRHISSQRADERDCRTLFRLPGVGLLGRDTLARFVMGVFLSVDLSLSMTRIRKQAVEKVVLKY